MSVLELVGGVRWYLRELSGEGKWHAYLDHCAREGCPPMSRREFERKRQDDRELRLGARCC